MTSHPSIQSCLMADLPGISADVLAKLNAAGIQTTAQLLQTAPTPSQRQQLARSLNLRDQVIGKWFAMADLVRIPAVGTRYCGLLLHCGVHSVQQLATADAGRLHRQVLRFQVALLRKKDQCPQLVDVLQWVRQAQQLNASDHPPHR